ncbi:MAG: AbrB/MazE/SpoVT family DNA-binding domain-containing protein [Burkholderiales bacterium]|nr:AbrB/MazE/SpoVT family DNA-binding domain-containing protein [Burkholderiales bacterium]
MDNVSVTSKGQVTIPKKVRTALGITAGTKVAFATEGNSARLMVVRTRKPSRVEDGPKILDYKGKAVTLDEMEEAIARGAEGSR